jgi:hypothetical protein
MASKHLTFTFSAPVAVVLAALLVGCGGGTSSSASNATSASASSGSGAGSSAPFLKPGSPTNELVEFGHEAGASERDAASAALSESLKAREDADFATQCQTFTRSLIEQVANPKKGSSAEKGCPTALNQIALPLSATKPFRKDTLGDGEVAALRIKGTRGEALYHGADGNDYAQAMAKEGAEWKVAELLTTELNPPEPSQSQANKRSTK